MRAKFILRENYWLWYIYMDPCLALKLRGVKTDALLALFDR